MDNTAGQEGMSVDAPIVQDEDVAPLPSADLKAILEALIFASPEPLTPKAIYKLLASEPKEDVQAEKVPANQPAGPKP